MTFVPNPFKTLIMSWSSFALALAALVCCAESTSLSLAGARRLGLGAAVSTTDNCVRGVAVFRAEVFDGEAVVALFALAVAAIARILSIVEDAGDAERQAARD
jgi:hypothetical protein